MAPVLTFFGRQGGKSKSAKNLIAQFPDDCTTYVEPFLGAGNVLLRIPAGKFEVEIVNDLDDMVYDLFSNIKKVSINDMAEIEFVANRQVWNLVHRTKPEGTPAEIMWHHLTHVWFSYGSMCRSYGQRVANIGDIRKKSFLNKLPLIKRRLSKVEVRYDDVFELLDEYKDDEKAFIYLDPPYYKTSVQGYQTLYLVSIVFVVKY
jgi:site-specific DNA-adenine methylase